MFYAIDLGNNMNYYPIVTMKLLELFLVKF
jgi:hypothetical protein